MTKEDWTKHVATVRTANPSLRHRELMRLASQTYRGSAAVATAGVLATAAIGKKIADRALKGKAGRITGNIGARISGSASSNPQVICPNVSCAFHKKRTNAGDFVRRSASTWGQYELVYCKQCGVILGTYAMTDRLQDAARGS